MFTATRLIAAIAIALLGTGALLFSAGTGPSPTPVASPSPTAWTPPPGWVTEEVEPGVLRILHDDASHDLVQAPPYRVAVGPDDAIWVLAGSGEPALFESGLTTSTLLQLGQEGTHPIDVPLFHPDRTNKLAIDVAGTVWVLDDNEVFHLDGGQWLREDPSPEAGVDFRRLESPDRAAVPPDGITWPVEDVRLATSLAIGPSGTAWVYLDTSADPSRPTDRGYMARLRDRVWDVHPASSGSAHYYTETFLAVDAADRAWMWFQLRWPRELPAGLGQADVPPGILSFDGERWHRHLEGILVNDVAFASDGSVWVTGRYGCDRSTGWDGRDRVRQCEQADPGRAGLYVISPASVADTR
jgi:hypothetical protein